MREMSNYEALRFQEDLRQVLGLAVGGSPSPGFRAEGIGLLGLLRRRLLSLLTLGSDLDLLLDLDRFLKLLPFDIVLVNCLLLSVELEADDALDLTDVSLNGKDLIHEAQLHLVVCVQQS